MCASLHTASESLYHRHFDLDTQFKALHPSLHASAILSTIPRHPLSITSEPPAGSNVRFTFKAIVYYYLHLSVGSVGIGCLGRTWRNDTRPLATCAPSVCCLVLHIIAIKINFILTPMTILLFSNSVLLSTSFMLHQFTEPRAVGKSSSSACYGDVADLAHLPGNDFHPKHRHAYIFPSILISSTPLQPCANQRQELACVTLITPHRKDGIDANNLQ
jgi:hypothetical protein